MDCFFPLFLVRVGIPKHGGCSTNVCAPSWQGNREGVRKVAKAQGNPWGNTIVHLCCFHPGVQEQHGAQLCASSS